MESQEIKSPSAGGCEKASIGKKDILFNDVEYDQKFRALQAYLPFVDNLLLQSSGKIASERLKSLQTMLKETNTKMKYDVMEKCESVLQSLMKKMEAAKNIKFNDPIPRTPTAQTSAVTQPLEPGVTTSTVTTNVPSACENSEQHLLGSGKNSVNQTNGHNKDGVKHSSVSKEKFSTQTSKSSCQSLNSEDLANKMSKQDPENRSMMRTLKLAAARTARNAETSEKVPKRVPITWDDTSTMASKTSEIDTLKLAAARAARFSEPPQIPDSRRGHSTKEVSKEPKESVATLQKCSDISTLKLAAARTTKQIDYPSSGADVRTNTDQEGGNSLEMSRNKLKKLIPPDSKVSGNKEKSSPRFLGTKFDLDSPRNDWDFQAAPESSSRWNPSPPMEDPTSWSVDGDCESNAVAGLKSPMDSEPDQTASRANKDSGASAGSMQSSSSVGSYYSPIHGLVQRRISTGPDSPRSPDESGPNTAEAKRRLRDKLSQEIHMVHRVGTSKGGSLRGLAAKDGKVLPINSKDDKKAGSDGAKRTEKIVEIDMFSKEVAAVGKSSVSEHSKESPKVLKGLYAPRYKSSRENSSAKSGIVSSEQKPASRSSVDANRSMKSPPSDSVSKKQTIRTESGAANLIDKLPETDRSDAAVMHSKTLSTMTKEELERAVHMNVRNLPSPPTIPALVLESGKAVPNSRPEKVILNPAFNSAPPLIEPGFFSKSDVDLRVQDPNGYHKDNSDFAYQQKNVPQNDKNRNPRTSYVSRYDRDTPMSPDGTSNHEQDHEVLPGPRHITYHLNKADGWQDRNSSGTRPQNVIEGNLPVTSPPGESFHNQYPQNRDAPWMNGGHMQMPYASRDLPMPQCEERSFQHPLGDQRTMQMPRVDERNYRMSGDERDLRGHQFHARNFQQPMGNQSVPLIQNEHGRGARHFSMGDSRFQGPNFYSGQNRRSADEVHFMQDNGRKMSNMQGDNSHRFHGPQFPSRNPVFDQRVLHTQDQVRMMNPVPAGNNHLLPVPNYQGWNQFGPPFESREQQIQHVQGRNINNQPFVRNHDYPMAHNQGQKPHLPIIEAQNQRLTPTLATPLNSEVPSVQGPNRDPRSLREVPRPETSKNDNYQWKSPPSLSPVATPSTRQTHGPQSAPIPILSPKGPDKDYPVHIPLSPLPSTTAHTDQILANQDCIPFDPPRILDPRLASKTSGQHTGPPIKGPSGNVPPKEISSKSQKSQLPTANNVSRKPRNSGFDSSQRRYNKDGSRRSSWEAEEARRREEKRKSLEQSQSHKKHNDTSSSQTLTNKGELVSPLNSLYGSTIIQKTGVGYGIQKFKIPKIKRPSPPKQLKPEVSASVASVTPGNPPVPDSPVILPVESTSLDQKAEEKSGPEQKLSEPKPVEQVIQIPEEQQPVALKPEEQPATKAPDPEKPHVEPLPLPAPLIVEAFMQQSNINLDVNQLLENLKLLGNLKPNQLKKFQNILMNSSSSDDSDDDTSSSVKKKKHSKLKTSKKKVSEELNKPVEEAEIKEPEAICDAVTDPLSKNNEESEEFKADVSEDKKNEVPIRKLRGRKPGPLSAKKKEQGTNSEAVAQSNEKVTEAAPKARNRRRNSLEILQADIKEMYISEGVLSASGRRICTMLKKEVPLTAAAKELPKKHIENVAESESDSQASTSKKKTPSCSSKKEILKKGGERLANTRKRSGRYVKDVDRSTCSSAEDDVSDEEGPVSKLAVDKVSDSDDNIPTPDQDVKADTDKDSQNNEPKSKKRKVVKRRKNIKEKNHSVPVTSSASDDDDEEEIAPSAIPKRRKTHSKTGSTDKSRKVQENVDYDSSPITKKKVSKALKLCESSDSCIESVSQSVISSTSCENVELSEKSPASIKSAPFNNSYKVNSSVNLSAYVKLHKMSASSLTPSPSFCSSDESSDIVPLTALIGPKSRQVARRGGRGMGPRSRRSQQVLSREDRVSSELDSSIPSEGFPKASASGASDDAYLGESISDIIDRLSKDDDDSKRGEVDDTPDEVSVGTKESVSGTKNPKKKRRSNWALGVIKKKRQAKSASPEAVNSESTAKKVDTSLSDGEIENAPENVVVPPEESKQADLESGNIEATQEEAEATAACGESECGKISALPSPNHNADLIPSPSADLADNDSLDQDNVECPEIDEDNGQTKLIRNVDKDYYIMFNLKSRKYLCKLCRWSGTAIVGHYTSSHPGNEAFISRLSQDAADTCIAESLEKGYVSAEDLDVESEKPTKKRNHTFTCRMCFFKCTNFVQFYDHCCGHTGEYRYKCVQCSAVLAGKVNICSHYQYRHKELRSLKDKYIELFSLPPFKTNGAFAYICSSCNFVQMCKSNLENHVKVHHAEECDSVKIVYFNMHIETDKKRISLRKSNKNVSDVTPEDSLDAPTETNHETTDGNSILEEGKDEKEIVDLAAFLPTDQEMLDHPKTDFDPTTTDVMDDSDASSFVCKMLTDDQNSLIDDLIRRTENLTEGKDNSALNQMNPSISDGILDGPSTNSLLTDELSDDSFLSDSTLTDDLPSFEASTGTSDSLNDVIKRLEASTAAELPVNLNDSEQNFGATMEELEPFEVKKVDDLAQQQVALHDQTASHCGQLEFANAFDSSSDETPFIQRRIKRLSTFTVLKENDDDEDAMNMCVIENVVSLASVTPPKSDGLQHEPSPLPPVILNPEQISCLERNIDDPHSRPCPSTKMTPPWQLPEIPPFVTKPSPLLNAQITASTAVKEPIPKSQSDQEAFVLDGGNNPVNQAGKVQRKALVQCLQAKAVKEPTAYDQMLERSKLRHLFKCMASSCSYSSNNAVDFGRHGAEHDADKYEFCAYCMKKFVFSKNRELVSHIQHEHGHCTFQCAYCFYRAVCPSYVVVHQNFSHTNKSISILQCLGSVEPDHPAAALSEVVPKYVCGQSDCGETFLLVEQFLDHLHESHNQIPYYVCHLCDTVCFDTRNFITHYRVHSLHLYQCRYCVHGASNEEAMHHHLCNAHPGQSPYTVMREAQEVNVNKPVEVEDLKIIDLGKKTAVEDSLIVKLSMTEMADEMETGRLMVIEPMQSEGEESESEAMVIDTSNETESGAIPIPMEASSEVGSKAEEILVKPSAEPICIDLDSEDEVTDLTSSAEDRSLRSLRSSPRKSTVEGETSERRVRPEKRPGPAKEEAPAKPRATTSFEFGAITLEDLNETGLSGEKLFRCGFSTCESSSETVEELREHLMVCDHSRNSHGLICPHCQRSIKNLAAFCDHLRSHSTCRYGCGLCLFRATAAKPVQAHLRSRHRITTTKCIPLNPLKADQENDLFVVGPLRPDKRKNHLVSQIQSPDKKSRPKYVYQPDEGHLLPIQAIYPFIVTCATCSFTTKVRKNMERHLTLHQSDLMVPSQNPVNAVPCLETKEMMFDKMTNLAASSNLKVPDATNLYLTPEDVARLPKFVPEQQRYRCGVQNCTYNSCDENMLIHHLRALHRDEDYYNCPHCLPAEPDEQDVEIVSRILIEKLSLHLKMHDNRLYKCGYCFYYDHRRHIVERHVTDKHTDYKVHVNVVREPFSEGTPVVSAKTAEKETGKELVPRYAWKCSRCEFASVTRPEMVNHSDMEHGKKLQYECGLCHSRFQSKQSFDQHCGFKHPGLKEQLLYNFFKAENAGLAVVEAAFDTRPLWNREDKHVKHIRGILLDTESTEVPEEVTEPEDATLAIEAPASKVAMFLCPICKVFETKAKADMKIHLYKELKYFRYQCTFCDKKVFSLTAGKKHMSRTHASTDAGTALTLFEKDLETEQKVEEILAAQEDLMQLDKPSKPTKPARPPKSKSQAVRPKEVPVARAKVTEEPTTSSARAPAISTKESTAVQAKESPAVQAKESPAVQAKESPAVRSKESPAIRAKESPAISAKESPAARAKESPAVRAKDVLEDANDSDVSVGLEDNDEMPTLDATVQLIKTFECKDCGQLFHTVRGLKVHIRLSHLSQGKWKCNTCQLTHMSHKYIKSHCKSAHPTCTINPPFAINDKRSLPSGIKTSEYWRTNWGINTKSTKPAAVIEAPEEPSKEFKCYHCEFRSPSILLLNRHEKRHAMHKPYRCGRCTYEAVSVSIVRSHSEKYHSDLPPLVEMMDIPEKTDILPVTSRQKRKQTLKTKKSYDSFEKSPPSKQPRIEAEVIELDSDDEDDDLVVTPVQASIPTAASAPTSASASKLEDTFSPVLMSVPQPMSASALVEQNVVHYRCYYCPLGASTRELVHKHWLQEHKNPRFAKDGNIYPNTGVSFHLETINRPLVEFPCDNCTLSFSSRSALQNHLESAHYATSDIECPKCEFKTPCADTMGAHLHKHSFEFKCSLCENSYLSKTSAEQHWQLAHQNEPFKADSFVLNLDSYHSLRAVGKTSAQMVKHSNVAKKSTSKMPRTGDFYARKSTGNAPWRRGIPIHPRRVRPPPVDLRNLSIKVPIGCAKVDMRLDTYANFHNINPKVLVADCEINPETVE